MLDLKRRAELKRCMELFFFAYRAFTSRPDKFLEKRGLNRVHHRIIHFVGQRPGLSVNALLEILAVSKQALNAPLRQLIGMKLISAKMAPHDRRVKKLYLTPECKKLEARLSDTQMAHLEKVFSAFGPTHEKAWREVMGKIAGEETGRTDGL
jgi:DNA-binding MarR family transcriptional regulator